MTITTPEFQGTHLWDRLCWAKEKARATQNRILCCMGRPRDT